MKSPRSVPSSALTYYYLHLSHFFTTITQREIFTHALTENRTADPLHRSRVSLPLDQQDAWRKGLSLVYIWRMVSAFAAK